MSPLEYASPRTDESRADPHWIYWAIYLGISWTWCIGMFLPVLLIRDYGVWAWGVFAVPNVVGAAAMGWVLSANGAKRIVEQHAAAVAGFTAVTVAFHVFFCVWFVPYLVWGNADQLAAFAGVIAALSVAMVFMDWRGPLAKASVFVLICSLVCALNMGRQGLLLPTAELAQRFAHAPPADLLPLAFVCLFGFALCPYLDATFLNVRRNTPDAASRRAFGVGFGIVFFAMIVLTLFYSRSVASLLQHDYTYLIGLPLGVHVLNQALFTVIAHLTEIRREMPLKKFVMAIGTAGAIAIAAIFASRLVRYEDMNGGELAYRLLLSFYGLVFPAYVWLCILPDRGGAKPSTNSLIVFAIACAAAAPMYWMGFIEKKMFWLIPGVAILLLARGFVRKHPSLKGRLETPAVQQNSAPTS